MLADLQTFPKLLAASRGSPAAVSAARPAATAAAGAQAARPATASSGDGDGDGDDDMAQTISAPPCQPCGVRGDDPEASGCCSKARGAGGDDGEAAAATVTDREPALLALLRVVRGVPPEALSQQLSTAVSAVVQALRSACPPLQAEALETFQVKSGGRVGVA